MDIESALAAMAQALKVTKELREINGEFDRAETKAKMADIYLSLADVKIALADAQVAIKTKDLEIQNLLEKMKSKAELVKFGGYTYEKNDTGKPTGSPYCPVCLDADGTLIRPTNIMNVIWKCPKCNASYSDFRKFPH